MARVGELLEDGGLTIILDIDELVEVVPEIEVVKGAIAVDTVVVRVDRIVRLDGEEMVLVVVEELGVIDVGKVVKIEVGGAGVPYPAEVEDDDVIDPDVADETEVNSEVADETIVDVKTAVVVKDCVGEAVCKEVGTELSATGAPPTGAAPPKRATRVSLT